ADQEPRPAAFFRLDPERPAELLDLVVDDVHADAAPRGLRELSGRAEAGLQDQLLRLLRVDLLVLVQQTLLDRLATDRAQVQPGAVARDLDQDLGALALQLQPNLAALGLP